MGYQNCYPILHYVHKGRRPPASSRKEAFDRYAWEVEYQQRDGDMRVLIMAREVREQLEQCVTEMRAIVGWPCNGDGDGNDSDAHSLTSIRALILAGLHEPSS